MSISSKGCRLPSPSSSVAPAPIHDRRLRRRLRSTITCGFCFPAVGEPTRSANRPAAYTPNASTNRRSGDGVPAGQQIIVLAPLIENESGEFRDVFEKLKREGFVRARIDGQLTELDRPEPIRLKKGERHNIEAVVDRLVIRDGIRVRFGRFNRDRFKMGRQPHGRIATNIHFRERLGRMPLFYRLRRR